MRIRAATAWEPTSRLTEAVGRWTRERIRRPATPRQDEDEGEAGPVRHHLGLHGGSVASRLDGALTCRWKPEGSCLV